MIGLLTGAFKATIGTFNNVKQKKEEVYRTGQQ